MWPNMLYINILLLLDIANIVPSGNPVLFVLEFDFSDDLVVQCPQEGIVECIALIVPCNAAAIFE